MAIGWTPDNYTAGDLFRSGPTIDIQIQHPTIVVQALLKAGKPVSGPAGTAALIDTGATFTAVDVQLATSLGLRLSGWIPVLTPAPGGPQQHPVFSASIRFVGVPFRTLDPIGMIGVDIKQQGIGCLLGRVFLAQVVMIYDGPKGRITMSQ